MCDNCTMMYKMPLKSNRSCIVCGVKETPRKMLRSFDDKAICIKDSNMAGYLFLMGRYSSCKEAVEYLITEHKQLKGAKGNDS